MSVGSKAKNSAAVTSAAISFGEKFVTSENFSQVFQEGMQLVEETAGYLDGPGRRDAKGLSSDTSFAYATESMRLTTRLMQLASWLLIRRAVNEGELTPEQAEEERHKVRLETVANLSRADKFEELPEPLQELVARSQRFYDRILKLDRMMHTKPQEDELYAGPQNTLDHQLTRLRAAFGTQSD